MILKLQNEIIALTSLVIFEAFVIATLIALVILLAVQPNAQRNLRRWF